MGRINNTNARDEEELIAKAASVEGLEIIDTGDKLWPKAITDGKVRVYIEGCAYLAWGATDDSNIAKKLETVGIIVTSIE